jgi:parallel beta-helix repeat protein
LGAIVRAFWAAFALVFAAAAYAQDPNLPSIVHPASSLQVSTETIYVEIEVLDGETYEVLYRQGQTGSGIDVAADFALKTDLAGSKQRRHASLAVPVGAHDVEVIQRLAAQPSYAGSSGVRAFSRVAATVTSEHGLLTGTQAGTTGKVVSQALGGVVQRTSPADRVFVFGETDLNGATDLPASLALSTDTTPLDGMPLAYYDESGSGDVESVLPLVSGEDEVRLHSPFLNGSDLYAFYWRYDHGAGKRELGLAKMTSGTPPFGRVTFSPSGGWFGDTYSIFRDGEVQPAGSAVVSGSTVYLYGSHRPSGATSDRAFVARVATNSAESKSAYEYWTEVSGSKAWRTTATAAQLVPLWENTGVPSVSWNVSLGRWVAIHSLETATLPPYGVTDAHSALAFRVSPNLQGRWSPPALIYARPQTVVGGGGSVRDPQLLPGLDDGAKVRLAATDLGEWTEEPNAKLYQADLAQVVIPPVLDTPPGTITTNPYSVTGFAAHGDTVRLYVGGVLQGSTTASATDGSFSIPASLVDGGQSAYAEAVSGSLVSAPSNTVTLTYQNNVGRSIGTSSISTNTVWTPGASPGTTGPYVINGTLTIASGATLTLMPGVVVKLDTTGVDSILVNGTLRVLGTATSKVTFQRNGSSTNTWDGITINSTGTAVIDHAILENAPTPLTVNGGLATVSNTEIRDFATNGILVSNDGQLTVLSNLLIDGTTAAGGVASRGIYFNGAGASSVSGATVRDCQTGTLISDSDPSITGSTFQANTTGVTINSGSAPSFTGNTVTQNATGISVVGSATNAAPTIRGNDVHSNTTIDLTATSFTNPLTSVVDAKDNWWGTTDPELIIENVTDQTDNSNSPTVDWTGFRSSSALAGAGAVPGSYISGPISGTVAAGVHTVIGDLIVPAGGSATLPAGAELRFLPETRLYAQGTLIVAGTVSSPVALKSRKAAPAAGDWDGVLVDGASTNSRIEFAVIEHAYRGVEVRDASVEISDSTILTIGRTGQSVDNSAGVYLDDSASVVQRTVIDNAGPAPKAASGIRITWNSNSTKVPVIDNNVLRNLTRGINATGPASGAAVGLQIVQNTIETNGEGVRLTNAIGSPSGPAAAVQGNFIVGSTQHGINLVATGTDPFPTITGNDIHGSTTWNLLIGSGYADPSSAVVVATGNWWGTTDLVAIRAKISDQRNVTTAAVADWSGPLDASIASSGVALTGPFLVGPQPAGTLLTSGSTYQVLSVVTVPVGGELTIPAGTTLRFQLDTAIDVSGTLTVQGGLLTSAAATPAAGDWDGIRVNASSTGTTISGATIEYAEQPIVVTGANVAVSGVTIRSFPSNFAGILYQTGSSGSIDGCDIDNATNIGKGIRLNNASPAVSGNALRDLGIGLELTNSTANVSGNTIESNGTGVNLLAGAHPTITGGNVITDNVTAGISLTGSAGNPTLDPKPVIEGNQIHANNTTGSGYNLRTATAYGNPATVIDAELNYWGSTDPVDIADWIRDNAEVSTYPIVDFSPFLDASGQPVGGGNTLSGTLASNTTLTASSSWSLISNVTVPSGVTLTVEDGVDVTVAPGSKLTVNGSIVITGTSGSRAVFRSSEAVPTTGAWEGIWIAAGGTASIDYADIRHGRVAVSAVDASGTVSITNTLFSDFGRGGAGAAAIWIDNSLAEIENNTLTHPLPLNGFTNGIHMVEAAAGSAILGNSIQSVTKGIYLDRSSPDIQGNTIFDNVAGIYVYAGSSPTIDGENVIRDNEWGIQIVGANNASTDPAPVVEGNDIYANDEGAAATLRNLTAATYGDSSAELDASGNWWGSTDPSVIAGSIFDHGDTGYMTGPYVDFLPFLDASVTASGAPVSGNFLSGIASGSTTLSAGTWDVLGSYLVAPGATLTVPAGSTLRMIAGATLEVEGTLTISGTALSPVLLTSQSASPTRGIWEGVKISAGSASVIDHAEIRWADRGVWIDGASATVSNSWIRDFAVAGIYVSDGGGTLSANTIDNTNDTATGIYLMDSSPAITGNDIRNTLVGIYMQGASNPVVNGHNVITSNRIGIQLNGGNPTQAKPNPVVNDNDIFSNQWAVGDIRNLQLSGYWDPQNPNTPLVLDFRRNWWGSTDPATILPGIEDQSGQAATVDVSEFLTSAGGSPSSTPVFTLALSNVRRSVNSFRPAAGESVSILFDLHTSATVTLKVFDEDDATSATPVRTITQVFSPGADRALVWDGRDGSGNLVDEDAYGYALVATDALGTTSWDPPPPTAPNGFFSIPSGADVHNVYRNDFWQKTATVTGNTARLDLTVRPVGSPTGYKIYDQTPFAVGTHRLVWDGRDATGQIMTGTVNIYAFVSAASIVKWNNVVVEDVDPNVEGVAPAVEVKSDPWYVVHSYGQFARITYHLDQSSLVTVKLLPPGIADPGHASAIAVVTNAAQAAGDYTVEWTGPAASDPNLVRTAEEGAFTFAIQAVSQSSGRSSLYRGVLQVRR